MKPYLANLNNLTANSMKKKIVFFDMDNVLVDYESALNAEKIKEQVLKKIFNKDVVPESSTLHHTYLEFCVIHMTKPVCVSLFYILYHSLQC